MEDRRENSAYMEYQPIRRGLENGRKRKKGGVMNLLMLQMILCLLTAILLLFGNIFLPDLTAPVKHFYKNEILKEDGENSSVFDVFANLFKETEQNLQEESMPEDLSEFLAEHSELSSVSVSRVEPEYSPVLTTESTAFGSVSETPLKTDFVIPLHGEISSGYGYRFHPVTGLPEFHKGIDIPAKIGTPIAAFRDGVVTKAEYSNSFGYYLAIQHGENTVTRYGHCSELLVKKGDRVKAGKTVALSGNTGTSTGPHCHFDLAVNSVYVDPLTVIPFSQGAKRASI